MKLTANEKLLILVIIVFFAMSLWQSMELHQSYSNQRHLSEQVRQMKGQR